MSIIPRLPIRQDVTMPETQVSILSDVSKTLLIPPYYRVIETQRPDAMIKKENAVELIKLRNRT